MLLIFPPIAKPSEPPAGIAKLQGALKANGIRCHTADMNLEALLYILGRPSHAVKDTWSRRAVKNISGNLAALKRRETFDLSGRYSRAVNDLNRALETAGRPVGVMTGLADYRDENLSPLRSDDLLRAAHDYKRNIFYPYFEERLPELLEHSSAERSFQEPFIGFSLNYLSQALCTFAMIGFLKKEFAGCKVVLGGGLITSWMKRPGWRNPFGGLVDNLVSGPGEQPLLALLNAGDAKTGNYEPDYGVFSLDDYLAPGFILPYSASSGCYWNKCSFCPETAEKNQYRTVSPDRTMTDISALIRKKQPALVHFLDNAISPALLRRLSEQPLGAPWYGFARFGKELLDIEYCMALKRSGCVMLKLGLESGDQGVLDALSKGIDLETASRILKNLRQAGIAAYAYLLFGTPQETAAEARKTLDFVARHHDAISFLNLAIFNMPLPDAGQGAGDRSLFYDGDLSLYTDFRHPTGWGRIQVRRFLDEEFKRHKAVASILKNDPPIFTSNHAAFFVSAIMREAL